MTRIYQLDTIAQDAIDSTHLSVLEDTSGVSTCKLPLAQLLQYLFSGASGDETNPFNGFSISIGSGVSAGGTNSIAAGYGSIASGNHSTAAGYYSTASASWGTSAFGHGCTASDNQASAFGHNGTASGHSSSALGYNNTASGDLSTAIGYENYATNTSATAAGYRNSNSGYYGCTAVGAFNSIYGSYGGEFSYPTYSTSVFGYYNVASGGSCNAMGSNNTVWGANPFNTFEDGDFLGKSNAFGHYNFVAGVNSTACGTKNSVATMGPVIEGSAFGFYNLVGGYWGASAVGYRNTSSYSRTSAIGHKNNATDDAASALGNSNTASGTSSTACGYNNTSSNNYASTFGAYNTASGSLSTACGYSCSAYGNNSTALGYYAMARQDNTVNIGGAIVIRADASEGYNNSQAFAQYGGVQNVVMTKDVDLTATVTYELDVPDNCLFYVDEVFLITDDDTSTISVQPYISFGWSGSNASILAPVQTSNLTANCKREVYTSLLTYDGQNTLTATITTAATADRMYGRFGFKGILIETTPIS